MDKVVTMNNNSDGAGPSLPNNNNNVAPAQQIPQQPPQQFIGVASRPPMMVPVQYVQAPPPPYNVGIPGAVVAQNQQLYPVPPGSYSIGGVEPPEAAVARPLSIIALFCFFQFWLGIPAIVLAYVRGGQRGTYKISIGLSVAAIVLGFCFALAFMVFGILMPFMSCHWNSEIRDFTCHPFN